MRQDNVVKTEYINKTVFSTFYNMQRQEKIIGRKTFFLTIQTTAHKRAVENIKAVTKHRTRSKFKTSNVRKGRPKNLTGLIQIFSGILN